MTDITLKNNLFMLFYTIFKTFSISNSLDALECFSLLVIKPKHRALKQFEY